MAVPSSRFPPSRPKLILISIRKTWKSIQTNVRDILLPYSNVRINASKFSNSGSDRLPTLPLCETLLTSTEVICVPYNQTVGGKYAWQPATKFHDERNR